MNKKLALILATTLLAGSTLYAQDISLVINGKNVKAAQPVQNNNVTLIPLRVISENLGAKVDWNKETQEVTITKGDTVIVLTVGNKQVKVNGVKTELQVAPQRSKEGTVMVPIRFISENLHAKVVWDKKSKAVSIDTTTKSSLEVKTDKLSEKEAQESTKELTNQEAVKLFADSQKRIITFLTGDDTKDAGKMEGYKKLKSEFSSEAKIEAYLEEAVSKNFYTNYRKELGENIKEKDGACYLILGDVGVVPEYDKAVVVKGENKEGSKMITFKVPEADETAYYQVTFVLEKDTWKVDAVLRLR